MGATSLKGVRQILNIHNGDARHSVYIQMQAIRRPHLPTLNNVSFVTLTIIRLHQRQWRLSTCRLRSWHFFA